MIQQCKGKDLDKVPVSKLETYGWIASVKYDGNYVQIHKSGDEVKFFTSGEKQFDHSVLRNILIDSYKGLDFVLEAEFIGETLGKLGDRTGAAKLTSYRTNFSKRLSNSGYGEYNDLFKVFDVIMLNTTFEDRFSWLLENIQSNEVMSIVMYEFVDTIEKANTRAKEVVKQGYEGIYLKHRYHKYYPGKRVNDAVKIKFRPTADLLCVGLVPGEGKYTGMTGGLILKDSKGRIVSVGSGLSDYERSKEDYIGKVIEISYEQIIDTYIQPTFIRVREDKANLEID